jgi:hypothetical protein
VTVTTETSGGGGAGAGAFWHATAPTAPTAPTAAPHAMTRAACRQECEYERMDGLRSLAVGPSERQVARSPRRRERTALPLAIESSPARTADQLDDASRPGNARFTVTSLSPSLRELC